MNKIEKTLRKLRRKAIAAATVFQAAAILIVFRSGASICALSGDFAQRGGDVFALAGLAICALSISVAAAVVFEAAGIFRAVRCLQAEATHAFGELLGVAATAHQVCHNEAEESSKDCLGEVHDWLEGQLSRRRNLLLRTGES